MVCDPKAIFSWPSIVSGMLKFTARPFAEPAAIIPTEVVSPSIASATIFIVPSPPAINILSNAVFFTTSLNFFTSFSPVVLKKCKAKSFLLHSSSIAVIIVSLLVFPEIGLTTNRIFLLTFIYFTFKIKYFEKMKRLRKIQ